MRSDQEVALLPPRGVTGHHVQRLLAAFKGSRASRSGLVPIFSGEGVHAIVPSHLQPVTGTLSFGVSGLWPEKTLEDMGGMEQGVVGGDHEEVFRCIVGRAVRCAASVVEFDALSWRSGTERRQTTGELTAARTCCMQASQEVTSLGEGEVWLVLATMRHRGTQGQKENEPPRDRHTQTQRQKQTQRDSVSRTRFRQKLNDATHGEMLSTSVGPDA